jgi:hypothetical protein
VEYSPDRSHTSLSSSLIKEIPSHFLFIHIAPLSSTIALLDVRFSTPLANAACTVIFGSWDVEKSLGKRFARENSPSQQSSQKLVLVPFPIFILQQLKKSF